MRRFIIALGFFLAAFPAWALVSIVNDAPQHGGAPAAPSCNAKITTSSGDGNAILTGSATALANLTCQ